MAALVLLAASGCGPGKPADVVEAERGLPDEVDFNLHIKPILSDRCFACHGPDANAREADLRLDTPEGAYAALAEGGHAIVPRSLRKSAVFRRIVSDDPDVRMPPPSSNLSLSAREVATIARWIEQGAAYKPHWSLLPPEAPTPPTPSDPTWAQNDIDRFVLARLDQEGMPPSPEADKETLLRRVTFDLTGLPPTLEEIDAFLSDEAPDAYERVVDGLLASDAYGERMASEWLDLARYADTHGYQDDGLRNMWPWRDWVIGAFNDNLPYDTFVTWQLAGDLLPEPTREQILATGFNRNHLQSQEGGIVPEEYRVEYVADRTETFGTAFLGLTVQCARCHDHKYDPVSQEEYFQLYAFFNNVNEVGNIPYAGEASPVLLLTSEEAEAELEVLEGELEPLEARLEPAYHAYDAGFEAWLAEGRRAPARAPAGPPAPVGDYPFDGFYGEDYHFENRARPAAHGFFWGDRDKIPTEVDGPTGAALKLQGDGWLDMGKDHYVFERNEPFSASLWFRLDTAGVAGPLFSTSNGLMDGKRGYLVELGPGGALTAALNHVFPDNGIEVRSAPGLAQGDVWHHVVLTYDGSSQAEGVRLYLDGERLPTTVINDDLRQSMRHRVDPRTGEEGNWSGPSHLRVGFVGSNLPKLDSTAVDAFQVFDEELSSLEVAALHGQADTLAALLQTSAEALTAGERAALRHHYVLSASPTYQATLNKATALRGEINRLLTAQPSVMIMRDQPVETRTTYVLNRGSYDEPTTPVEHGTPASVGAFPDALPRNRLGLARWLTADENPLFARVAVNRYWQMLFGRGLVVTSEDFGNQGDLPSHPLLLDHLARSFQADGYDLKGLLKRMVMSATYRQASAASPELREVDPDNRLLARGPSRRLTAEMARDQALAASGLLVREIGGPPVKPYQPDGLWEALATRNATKYVQDTGDKLYRRSLYTIWKRTTPPPSMISFDAAERNICTVRRQSTSTPLQALVLLNDPQFVEAARALAARVAREETAAEARVTRAFRHLTSRHPTAQELALLQTLYDDERAAFEADPDAALALTSVGDSPPADDVPAAEAAALTVVASTIMNYDAAIIKR